MLNCHTKCKKKPIIISSTIQVEDVNKKFEALKDAESRAWVEERKPPPRPKRLVKVKSLHVHTCLHYNSTACYLVVYISKNFDLSYSDTVSCPRQANRKQSSSKVSPGCCKSCHEGQTAGSREHQLQCWGTTDRVSAYRVCGLWWRILPGGEPCQATRWEKTLSAYFNVLMFPVSRSGRVGVITQGRCSVTVCSCRFSEEIQPPECCSASSLSLLPLLPTSHSTVPGVNPWSRLSLSTLPRSFPSQSNPKVPVWHSSIISEARCKGFS